MRHQTSGKWYLSTLDGHSVLKKAQLRLTSNQDWDLVKAADFNGDGQADVLLRHKTSGKWLLYSLNGHTILDAAKPVLTTGLGWQVAAIADVDGDNDSDVT